MIRQLTAIIEKEDDGYVASWGQISNLSPAKRKRSSKLPAAD